MKELEQLTAQLENALQTISHKIDNEPLFSNKDYEYEHSEIKSQIKENERLLQDLKECANEGKVQEFTDLCEVELKDEIRKSEEALNLVSMLV